MAMDRDFAYICLCVYSSVICCSPSNVFAPHFAFLGMTLASLCLSRDAGRSLWADLGSQGILLGVTLASLWLSWDAGGTIWGTLGSQVELGLTLGQNMNVPFR